MSVMSKAKKATTPQRVAAKKTARKPVVPAETRPLRRKGPVLPIDTIELPRVPGHEYGQHQHVSTIQPGDIIYVGGRQNLSTLEVAEVRIEKGANYVTVLALAVDFQHDGAVYNANEQVTFRADTNSRIGVKNS